VSKGAIEEPEVVKDEFAVDLARSAQDEYARRVVNFHVAAEQHASCAVYCAAAAGAVMIQKKKVTPHGRFTPWLRSLVLPDGRCIGLRTAQNYMTLAREMEARIKLLAKTKRVSFLPEKALKSGKSMMELLADFDPTKTHELRNAAIADAVKEVTGEQTLRQLYFSWDIVKPAKTGYQKYTPAKKLSDLEKLKAQREAARHVWTRIRQNLEFDGIRECTWGLLPDSDREAIVSLLDEISRNIKKSLRGR